MDSLNNNLGMGPELYAMKKAMEIQGQGVMKVLESASPTPTVSGSELTGLGQNLDIKA
jgi:hypothetical protein